jgi:cysteine desulfurase
MKAIYLDHAASTPLHPLVLEQMLPFLTEVYGNPSSMHTFGRAARAALNEARDSIAIMLHCESKELIWTSGGTESDNLAIFGSVLHATPKSLVKNHIITSQIEHHAVLYCCQHLERLGYKVTYLPVDSQGLVHVEDLITAIRPETALISIMYGNNEVGTMQPIMEIGRIARDNGILFHVDAVQALGHVDIDLNQLPIDLMSFSAHKIAGPKGIGLLYCSRKVNLSPQIYGGSQERKRRAGTENVASAVGFAAAVKLALEGKTEIQLKLLLLRQTMLQLLAEQLHPNDYIVHGHPELTLPHILNVSFPGVETETMLMNLDLEGICAASGSACSSGSLEVSHVIKAMHLPEHILSSAVRFSFSSTNTTAEIVQTVEKIATIVRRVRIK